jgi:predicted phosphohydrolase
MNLIWLTDIHLDFIDDPLEPCVNVARFGEFLNRSAPDGVLITGDISLAGTLTPHLSTLDRVVNKPIYFVCGNHDFYDGGFSSVQRDMRALCESSRNLRYLSQSDPISLTENVALVGHDGWYDGLHGNPWASGYVMSDWLRIEEYIDAGAITSTELGMSTSMPEILDVSRRRAAFASEHVKAAAALAARDHKVVVIATHVPPYPQVHNGNGKTGNPHAVPWYTSRLMGDAIIEVASENPNVRFEVFCGHSHGKCDIQVDVNVFCHVGASKYGSPGIAGTLQLP